LHGFFGSFGEQGCLRIEVGFLTSSFPSLSQNHFFTTCCVINLGSLLGTAAQCLALLHHIQEYFTNRSLETKS